LYFVQANDKTPLLSATTEENVDANLTHEFESDIHTIGLDEFLSRLTANPDAVSFAWFLNRHI